MIVQSKRSHVTDEIRQAVLEQLEVPVYYRGEQNFGFECELASYLGVRHVLMLNAGTSALLATMAALGISPGDEVIIPANGYLASVEATVFWGATPVFCDVDETTATVTAETIAARLTPRTRVVVPVHMYGHPADMDPILDLARQRELKVVEVCAHALGARYRGRLVGGSGDAAIFSFGGKGIWVGSNGGALATNSTELWREADMFSRHGWPRIPVDESHFGNVRFGQSAMAGRFPVAKESHRPGLNLQLSEISCRIGRINLKYVEAWNRRRREVAELYTRLIEEAGVPVRPPAVKPWVVHSFLHYVVRAADRDGLARHLTARGIEVSIHYATALPEERCYRHRFPTDPALYPAARKIVGEILSLPIHPWITDDEVCYVVEQIVRFYRRQ